MSIFLLISNFLNEVSYCDSSLTCHSIIRLLDLKIRITQQVRIQNPDSSLRSEAPRSLIDKNHLFQISWHCLFQKGSVYDRDPDANIRIQDLIRIYSRICSAPLNSFLSLYFSIFFCLFLCPVFSPKIYRGPPFVR